MKRKLAVSRDSSRKVDGMHTIATLIGWLFLMAGIIFTIVGVVEITSYDFYHTPNPTPLFVGVGLITSSFTWLFVARLFKALYPIVRVSEVQDAKNSEKYEITVIEDVE